jgi:hypothetical protein
VLYCAVLCCVVLCCVFTTACLLVTFLFVNVRGCQKSNKVVEWESCECEEQCECESVTCDVVVNE